MRNNLFIIILLVLVFILGFFVGYLHVTGKLPIGSGCQQIARWHQDYLMREYGINFMETDQQYPNREINQRATDLNAQLLRICSTDPNKVLNQSI